MHTPGVRFRLDLGRDTAVGPGKIALLEHIAHSGSLSQAARELKMSYRRAWLLLESLNLSFIERVAVTAKGGRGGGGATLTKFGRQLIRVYREFDADIQQRAARCFRPILEQTRSAGRPQRRSAPLTRLKDRLTSGTQRGRRAH